MALWGKQDQESDKPKYLNAEDKANTLGIDESEAQELSNIQKGINSPGWVKYVTYVDGNGNTRHKSEVLVAMSSITGGGLEGDLQIQFGSEDLASGTGTVELN